MGVHQSDLCRERTDHAETRKERDTWHSRAEAFKQAAELAELGAKKAEAALTNERTANAETRKQYMELIMAVARKFDGETRHQTALRYIKHAEDRAREAGKADAETNRLDAEAKEGK